MIACCDSMDIASLCTGMTAALCVETIARRTPPSTSRTFFMTLPPRTREWVNGLIIPQDTSKMPCQSRSRATSTEDVRIPLSNRYTAKERGHKPMDRPLDGGQGIAKLTNDSLDLTVWNEVQNLD